jgi:hypothetical protein
MQMIYPAVFNLNEAGDVPLVGSAAKAPIRPMEAYLFVPQKMIITVERALNSKEIGHIF